MNCSKSTFTGEILLIILHKRCLWCLWQISRLYYLLPIVLGEILPSKQREPYQSACSPKPPSIHSKTPADDHNDNDGDNHGDHNDGQGDDDSDHDDDWRRLYLAISVNYEQLGVTRWHDVGMMTQWRCWRVGMMTQWQCWHVGMMTRWHDVGKTSKVPNLGSSTLVSS